MHNDHPVHKDHKNVGLKIEVRENIENLKRVLYALGRKSLEHMKSKVWKGMANLPADSANPRRRYGPKVRMDGGCYTMYTMYTMYPSLGGGTPGGTPGIIFVSRLPLCDSFRVSR